MIVKFKKLSKTAQTPFRASADAAGYDLYADTVDTTSEDCITINTNIAVEIPKGYVGFIFPRSSIYKTNTMLANSVGVIDSDYRGPLIIKLRKMKNYTSYKSGERCAQLLIQPVSNIEFVEVEELESTDRGEGGFGSSGK